MSTCECYKIGVTSSNVLFFYLPNLCYTRFSTSFASFLRNVHNVVIGHLCTRPLPSLRRFLEMKMHNRKQVSCRKRFTLLRCETTVYRKSALSRLLVARNWEMGYNLQDQSFSEQDRQFPESIYNLFLEHTLIHGEYQQTVFCSPKAIISYPFQSSLVQALLFPQHHL